MADKKTKLAAMTVSALMTTSDDALEEFRAELGSGNPASNERLKRLREVLLTLADAVSDKPTLPWERVDDVHRVLIGGMSPKPLERPDASASEPPGSTMISAAPAFLPSRPSPASGSGVPAPSQAPALASMVQALDNHMDFDVTRPAVSDAMRSQPLTPSAPQAIPIPVLRLPSAKPPEAKPMADRPSPWSATHVSTAAAVAATGLPFTAPKAPEEPRPIDPELLDEGTMAISLRAHEKSPLPFRPAASGEIDPEPLAALQVESYASLCALIGAFPERSATTHAQYGILDPAARVRLDEVWRGRFATDPALYELWSVLYGQFHQWLVAHGRYAG